MMSAPEKIWAIPAIGGGWKDDMGMWCKSSTGIAGQAEFTRTDLSQASVAAALEAAATRLDNEAAVLDADALRFRGGSDANYTRKVKAITARTYASAIRALITPDQHDALSAHVAAEVAEAGAGFSAWLPVEDAPQDGTAVITIKSNGDVGKGAWYKNPFGDENTFIDRASGKWWTAVGWLPMPKALDQIGAKP